MANGVVEFANGLVERLRSLKYCAERPDVQEQEYDQCGARNPVQGEGQDLAAKVPPDFTDYLTDFFHFSLWIKAYKNDGPRSNHKGPDEIQRYLERGFSGRGGVEVKKDRPDAVQPMVNKGGQQ